MISSSKVAYQLPHIGYETTDQNPEEKAYCSYVQYYQYCDICVVKGMVQGGHFTGVDPRYLIEPSDLSYEKAELTLMLECPYRE